MRSGLYRLAEGRPFAEEDRIATDAELLNLGHVPVGMMDGHEIVHSAPGAEPIAGSVTIQSGETPWKWSDLLDRVPDVAAAVLQAPVRLPDTFDASTGASAVIRETRGQAAARLPAKEVLEDAIPPHYWSGDE